MLRVPSSDGVELAVHDLGGRPDGPPILFCHATGFHGLVWTPLARRLADRFRCWSLDFRGHGDSLPPADLRFEWSGFGRDVLAVLDALGLDHPFGVGHSKGGAALLMAEIARPGTFRGLWLFEPIVPPPPPPDAPPRENPLARGARRRREVFASRDEAYANYASKPPLSVFDPEALRAYVDHGFADTEEGTVRLKCRGEWEARVFEMGGAHDTFAHLGEVRAPVTVVAGADEPFTPSSFAPAIAAQIPGARFVRHDELDHFGPLDDPEHMAAEIAAAFGA